MVPLEIDRKKQLKFVEYFKEILERYEEDKDRKMLTQYYIDFEHQDKTQMAIRENKHHKWYDKKLPECL